MPEPCGSLRVLAWIEGNEAEVVWCRRTEGPCPYPGSGRSRGDDVRPCAVDTGVEP